SSGLWATARPFNRSVRSCGCQAGLHGTMSGRKITCRRT
uniref:Uncharacterized protein n=1 Tax=Parascaris univalens TaxID=6257 RepID=A0A915BUN8_PARUN